MKRTARFIPLAMAITALLGAGPAVAQDASRNAVDKPSVPANMRTRVTPLSVERAPRHQVAPKPVIGVVLANPTPVRPGIRISKTQTAGSCASTAARASSPFAAVATMV